MCWRLEGAFQVHDERMVDSLEDAFLALHMLDLLQTDDLTFLQALQSQRQTLSWFISMFYQAYSSKRTSAESRNKVEVIEHVITCLFSLESSFPIFWPIKRRSFWIIQYVFRLLLILNGLLLLDVFFYFAFKRFFFFSQSHLFLFGWLGSFLLIKVILIVVVFMSVLVND